MPGQSSMALFARTAKLDAERKKGRERKREGGRKGGRGREGRGQILARDTLPRPRRPPSEGQGTATA